MGVTVALHQHPSSPCFVRCSEVPLQFPSKTLSGCIQNKLSWMKNELGGRELGIAICFVSTSFLTLSEVWKSY